MPLIHIGDIEPIDVSGQRIREVYRDKDGRLSVAYAVITKSRPHHHKLTTELYYVADGCGEIFVDGKRHEVRAHDFLEIKPGEVHWAQTLRGHALFVYVTAIPAWSEDDYYLPG